MKVNNKIIKSMFLSVMLTSFVSVNAGNEDRAGSAGATEPVRARGRQSPRRCSPPRLCGSGDTHPP